MVALGRARPMHPALLGRFRLWCGCGTPGGGSVLNRDSRGGPTGHGGATLERWRFGWTWMLRCNATSLVAGAPDTGAVQGLTWPTRWPGPSATLWVMAQGLHAGQQCGAHLQLGLSVQPAMAGRQVHGGDHHGHLAAEPRPAALYAAGGDRQHRDACALGNQAGAGPGWAGLTGRDDRALGIDQHRLPGIQGRAGVVGHAGRPAPAGDRDHPRATQDPANQRVIEQVGEGGKRTLRRLQSYRATARTTGSETRRGCRRAGARRAPGRARLRPAAGWQAATRSAAPAAPGDRRSARVAASDVHAHRPGPPPACAPTAHRPAPAPFSLALLVWCCWSAVLPCMRRDVRQNRRSAWGCSSVGRAPALQFSGLMRCAHLPKRRIGRSDD
jgi:hypothetical protein